MKFGSWRLRRNLARGAAIVGLLVFAVTSAASAQLEDQPGRAPEWARGQRAIQVLGDRLPAVAQAYGVRANILREMFIADPTLAVDENDELLYVEPELADVGQNAADTTAQAPPTTDPVFQLASRPGADHTIYLDFDGHVTEGTSWNNSERPSIVSPAYDTDNDPESWSASELSIIRSAYEAVAEDFAPFDVNVTTIEPSEDDLRDTGNGDTRWGVRVIISDDTAGLCGCGGIAYIGSFDDRVDEPVFVFNTSRTGVAEAISHEVGHALLLAHDGQVDLNTYYRGHGSGDQGWGTIMGAAYNRKVSQWSQGEYAFANNIGSGANFGNGEDDVAVIASLTNGNGFGFVSDDHGATAQTATVIGSGTHTGTISTATDIDAFRISTGGGLQVDVAGQPNNPNLDPLLEVRTLNGTLIERSNDPTSLSASISLPTLAAGEYLIVVDGTGWGTPLASTSSGWTGYGSLGNYELVVTADDTPPPPDSEPPSAPVGLTVSSVSADQVTLTWTGNTEPDLASYSVERSDDGGATWSLGGQATAPTFTDNGLASSTTYLYRVLATDSSGNTSGASAAVSATTDDPPPPEPVGPNVVVRETAVSGSVSGTFALTRAADGAAQELTESSSGGRRDRRYDQLDHRWEIDVSDGNHRLAIEAVVTDGGDNDAGFAVSWSTSASGPWTDLAVLTPTRGSLLADLGSPSGTMHIRVVDTNRAAGNTSFDSIAIDLIELNGGAPVTEPPATVISVQPGDGATGVSTSPTLSWTPVAGASSYRVTVTGDVAIAPQTTTANSVSLTGLSASSNYQWQVEAINEVGSSTSAVFTFTTAAPATSVSVDSLTTTTESARRGNQRVVATAVVVDDRGEAVSGASVTVQVAGSITETMTGTTDATGTVRLTTTSVAKKPSVTVCVSSVSASLPWQPTTLACD